MLQEVGEVVSKLVFGSKAKSLIRQELDVVLNSWKSRLSLTQVKQEPGQKKSLVSIAMGYLAP